MGPSFRLTDSGNKIGVGFSHYAEMLFYLSGICLTFAFA